MKDKKLFLENGGPISPCDIGIDTKTGEITAIPTSSSTWKHFGMFLRDYVAVNAMTGILSHYGMDGTPEKLAEYSYEIADAMLQKRQHTKGLA